MVDFINEVEEELRKDEYNRLLRRYGPYLLGIVIAIVAVTGFMEWQKSSDDRAARATSAAFVEASDMASDGETTQAIRQFLAIADKAPEGYSGLSYMRAAALELDSGNSEAAMTYYDRAAATFTRPRHKQLAQLKAAYILANQGRYDDVAARVSTLAVKDAPYEFLARELAGFAALNVDDASKARQEFSYLASIPGVPDSIRQRAEQALSLMQLDRAAEPVEGVAPTDTADELTVDDVETPPAPENSPEGTPDE